MYQDYTIPKLPLTLKLNYVLPKNHLAAFISYFVDSIPEAELLETKTKIGRPAYHPAIMLKIFLFAYHRRVFSGRKIERMLKENLPMMALAERKIISYHTLNNFRSNKSTNALIKKCFLYFDSLLVDQGLIREGSLFIDGTKIEADANRYTFTWRRAVEKNYQQLNAQAEKLYHQLIDQRAVKAMNQEEVQTSQGLAKLANETKGKIAALTQKIAQEPKAIPGGSPTKRKRRGLKKLLHQIQKDYLPRERKYEQAEQIFNGRNSFSKTDHDATFMHMKEDHMKNGQLKPGYNIQVATSNQYVIDYALYPNPTDFKTFKPFMAQMQSRHLLDHFKNIVADAGYGSEDNYTLLADKYGDKDYFIPYTTYEKELTRKYKHDQTKLVNWYYNEKDDYYVDWQGVRFNFKYYSRRKDRNTGQVRDFKVYEADKFQLSPELEQLAKTPHGRQRQIHYNPSWQYFKAKAKKKLQSKHGKHIYGMRKNDVEPVFGFMKNVYGMRRAHLRGKKKVENDVGLMFLMMNLSKYWKSKGQLCQF